MQSVLKAVWESGQQQRRRAAEEGSNMAWWCADAEEGSNMAWWCADAPAHAPRQAAAANRLAVMAMTREERTLVRHFRHLTWEGELLWWHNNFGAFGGGDENRTHFICGNYARQKGILKLSGQLSGAPDSISEGPENGCPDKG